jgi:hypothetical protein
MDGAIIPIGGTYRCCPNCGSMNGTVDGEACTLVYVANRDRSKMILVFKCLCGTRWTGVPATGERTLYSAPEWWEVEK